MKTLIFVLKKDMNETKNLTFKYSEPIQHILTEIITVVGESDINSNDTDYIKNNEIIYRNDLIKKIIGYAEINKLDINEFNS